MKTFVMFLKHFWYCFIRDELFKEGRGTHDYCKYCSGYSEKRGCQGVKYL